MSSPQPAVPLEQTQTQPRDNGNSPSAEMLNAQSSTFKSERPHSQKRRASDSSAQPSPASKKGKSLPKRSRGGVIPLPSEEEIWAEKRIGRGITLQTKTDPVSREVLQWPEPVYVPAPKTLKPRDAVEILQNYAGSLRNNLGQYNAQYVVTEGRETQYEAEQRARRNGQKKKSPKPLPVFVGSVSLPFNSPVGSAKSEERCTSKKEAKAAAAYIAIRELMHYGEIGPNLELTPRHPSSAKGGTKVSKADNGVDRTSPYLYTSWWRDSPPLKVGSLWGSVIRLELEDERAPECRPLVLVTSRPLPFDGVEFDVWGETAGAIARLSPSFPLEIREKDLDRALAYSTTLFESVSGRPLQPKEPTRLLILPLKWAAQPGSKGPPPLLRSHITWGEVVDTWQQPLTPLKYRNNPDLKVQLDGRVLCGTTHGPRWIFRCLRNDLTASSRRNGGDGPLYAEFQKGERKELGYDVHRGVTDFKQPLLEAEPDIINRAYGVVSNMESDDMGTRLLIPQMLLVHSISAGTLRTASMLHRILGLVDTQLLATEMSTRFFNGRIDPYLLRPAITASHALPIGARVKEDYQRLELLGDSGLRLATRALLYCTLGEPRDLPNEGILTQAAHELEANATLTIAAKSAGITPYIRGVLLPPREWVPQGWDAAPGAPEPKHFTSQPLGDKVVADVAEAVIGAALISARAKDGPLITADTIQAVLDTLRILKVPVSAGNWSSFHGMPVPMDVRMRFSSEPLCVFGYTFRDPVKGRIALTMDRQSLVTPFQRYEFLGDALLNTVAVAELWDEYPLIPVQALTHAKHSRVSNGAFTAFMIASGLIELITDDSLPELTASLAAKLAAAQKEADKRAARGQTLGLDYWTCLPERKRIGDVLEALFGAIIDDSDFDLIPAMRVYSKYLLPFQRRYAAPPTEHSLHPHSQFLMQLDKRACFGSSTDMHTQEKDGKYKRHVSVKIHGEKVAYAVAESKALAERLAFSEALAYLERNPGGACGICATAQEDNAAVQA